MKNILIRFGLYKAIFTLREKFRERLALIGVDLRQKTKDRYVLEEVIFSYVNNDIRISDILFIGTNWYTKIYCKILKNKNFITMECDEARARFGSCNNILDTFENVGKYFDRDSLDLVICNGVIGYGLNSKVNIEKSLNSTYEILRPGGVLILGLNNTSDSLGIDIEQLALLNRFINYYFEPLNDSKYHVEQNNNHRYVFLQKKVNENDTKDI